MPKRNIVWIVVGALIATLLWKVPEALIRRDSLYSQFSPLLDVHTHVLKHYVEDVDRATLLRGAIDGMLSELDPYSHYYSQREFEQFRKRIQGQFKGIGIVVDKHESGDILVVSPIEGSPAFINGLRAGDRITHVEGEVTADLSLEQGVDLILGEAGTPVSLTIYRPASDEILEKTIVREIVKVPTVRGWARTSDWRWSYLIDAEHGIGYLRILSFGSNSSKEAHAVIRDLLVHRDMKALLIDVRDNPGGDLEVVVDLLDRFVDEGVLVSTWGRNRPEHRYMATAQTTYDDFPLVVLVNGGSASASEILAGGLRDHGRATIVGEQTFGKGSMQETFPILGGRGEIKLTTGYWFLPKGERIHDVGITPDVVVELTDEQREAMLQSRMEVYSTASMPASLPAVSTAPSDAEDLTSVTIDPQLQAGLDVLIDHLQEQKE